MEELWLQLRNLVAWYARRYYKRIIMFDGTVPGSIEVDDLIQTGYFAITNAIADYDQTKGAFTTYLHYHIKKEFRRAVGRSDRQLNDPLNNYVSLDAPIDEDDPNSLTKLDYVPDQRNDIADADERIFLEELHTALEHALNTLPVKEATVIRSEFYDGCKQRETAEKLNISTSRVEQMKNDGLRHIRNSAAGRQLEKFLDDETSFYKGVGLGAFKRTRTSGIERMVLNRERKRKELEMKLKAPGD